MSTLLIIYIIISYIFTFVFFALTNIHNDDYLNTLAGVLWFFAPLIFPLLFLFSMGTCMGFLIRSIGDKIRDKFPRNH